MPRNSKDSMLKEWAKLLKAVNLHQDDLGGVAPFRDILEKAYAEALANRAVQEAMKASAKDSTRRLRESLGVGYYAAISLRHFIKSVLGTRSEKLVRYGVKPRRARRPPVRSSAIGFRPPR